MVRIGAWMHVVVNMRRRDSAIADYLISWLVTYFVDDIQLTISLSIG